MRGGTVRAMRPLPLLLILALLALALGFAAARSDEPKADLVIVNRGGVTILDPQRMSWLSELRVGRMIYEGLVRHDPLTEDFEIVPGVAESWTLSPDRRTYTFTLREDARWSNGDPVTSSDFRYAWRRGMLPDLGGDFQQMFLLIEGGRAFSDWRLQQLRAMARGESAHPDGAALWDATIERFDSTVGVRTPDERTFEVTLERPVPYFLDLAAFGVFAPVHAETVRGYETINAATGGLEQRLGWTKPGVLVTNGPFTLERWRFKRDMRFVKDPMWWDAGKVTIGSILIPEIEDPSSAVLAFETGVVDWNTDVVAPFRGDMVAAKLAYYQEHAETVERLSAEGAGPLEIDRALPPDPRLAIHSFPAFGTYFWNFNCRPTLPGGKPNPFADARVRRAFAMVIDRAAIARDIRRIGESPARTLIPPGSIGGYESPAGVRLFGRMGETEQADVVEEAKALLAEAGYPDPGSMPAVELLFNKDGGHDLIAQVVQKNWQEHLGVDVRLAQKEIKVFRDDLKKQRYMTGRAGWYGDYGDPTTFLDVNRKDDGNNDRKYANAEFEALHPFLDGNGRLGRMLVPLFLYERKVLGHPAFYISEYLEQNREEYYERLLAVSRDDDWTGWIAFFLRAMAEQARVNTRRARAILQLYESRKRWIVKQTHSQYAVTALDFMFRQPIFSGSDFTKAQGIPKPTARRILATIRDELLRELRPAAGQRPAIYAYRELLNAAEGREAF